MCVIADLDMTATIGLFNKFTAGKSQGKWSQKQ
jgi:hypothetical protein